MSAAVRRLVSALGVAFLAVTLWGQTFEVVHAFPAGGEPRAPLVEGAQGVFYGTTSYGGVADQGTVFRIDSAGNLVTLHRFTGLDGVGPSAALLLASDGYFYGTTVAGGAHENGTLFRMDAEGRVLTLHDFDISVDGFSPLGSLIQAVDGSLYGTTGGGGPGSSGTVFRFDLSSGILTLVHVFTGEDGATPRAGLLQASDGRFFGTTGSGGTYGGGTVFRIDQSGVFTSLHSFTGNAEPANLAAPLIEAADGWFYGTGASGGLSHGAVFRMDGDGNITTIHSFTGLEGGNPEGPLVQGLDGDFYGTAQSTVFRMNFLGSLVFIHTLTQPEGARAASGLIQASDGRFYGTAIAGGTGDRGTVFAVDTTGDLTALHSFVEEEGLRALAGLTEAPDGFLYGANAFGGVHNLGTLFRMNLLGGVAPLHQFGPPDPGASPHSSLLRTSDGNLYGATGAFGAEGSVFRLAAGNSLTTLSTFGGGNAASAVIQASDGNLYGTTPFGGAYNFGTIFRIDASGSVTTFHSFGGDDGANGLEPAASLIQGSDGALYGTTWIGGAANVGLVFRIDLLGNISSLHDFSGPDGAIPSAPLIQTGDGSLYGTTSYGGVEDLGAVFRIDSGGGFATIHEFVAGEGAHPAAGVLLASDGALYGTTYDGGFANSGTVFKIDGAGAFSTVHFFSVGDGRNPQGSLLQASDGNIYGTADTVFRLILSSFAVTSLAPLAGAASGGTRVAVGGAGFDSGATLSIGGAACPDAVVEWPARITATAPALPPGSLNDVEVVNLDSSSATLPRAYFADFLDMPASNGFHDDVERMARYGITAGCGGGSFCPGDGTTRAQAAVFLLRAEHGPTYAPPPCAGIFADTPCPGPFTDWVEGLAGEGIAAGCGAGNFCPDDAVTRAQLAVLLLRTAHGPAYAPPACAGVFQDVVCPSLYADWIEELFAEDVTGGCLKNPPLYCPGSPVTRGQAAAFFANTFKLP